MRPSIYNPLLGIPDFSLFFAAVLLYREVCIFLAHIS